MSKTVKSKTSCIESAHGRYYITITEDNKITCHVANTSSCSREAAKTITDLVNLMLGKNMRLDNIVTQLKGIQCCPTINQANSTADAIGKVLETNAAL